MNLVPNSLVIEIDDQIERAGCGKYAVKVCTRREDS